MNFDKEKSQQINFQEFLLLAVNFDRKTTFFARKYLSRETSLDPANCLFKVKILKPFKSELKYAPWIDKLLFYTLLSCSKDVNFLAIAEFFCFFIVVPSSFINELVKGEFMYFKKVKFTLLQIPSLSPFAYFLCIGQKYNKLSLTSIMNWCYR